MLGRVATVCARFNKLPSDYMSRHTWSDLTLDYEAATVLNEYDQEIENQKYAALAGKK